MGYNGKHLAQLGLELDSVLPQAAARARLTALSIDIDVAGARLSRAYGENGRPAGGSIRPVYSTGCLLDMVLAIASAELSLRGELDLDVPVDTYLPELTPPAGGADAPILVRHLLTRTSGIQDPRSIDEMQLLVPWGELAPRVRDAPRLCSPGVSFNYAGIDRALLLVLLERVVGRPLRRIVRELVIDPCGIALRPEQLGEADADGVSPIRKFDTKNFINVVSNLAWAGDAPAANPFSADMRSLLQAERVRLSRSLRVQPWPRAATAFTLGLFRYSDGLTGFNGWERNQSCGARFDPLDQVAFVVALEGPPPVRDLIIGEVAQRLGYTSVHSSPSPCTVGSLNGLRPAEVTGRYQGWAAGYAADVERSGAEILCQLSYRGEAFQRMRARVEGDGWLVVDRVTQASALEFYRDPMQGKICMAFGFLPYAMERSATGPAPTLRRGERSVAAARQSQSTH